MYIYIYECAHTHILADKGSFVFVGNIAYMVRVCVCVD